MAKLVSSPSAVGDGGVASTVPPSTSEETTAAVTTAGGDSEGVSREETPEARALAQGPYNHSTSLLVTHLYITLIVEFYFADTNLPYDKSVLC